MKPPPGQSVSQDQQPNQPWQYGGFGDVAYLLDFHDVNKLFRSRGTAWHVDDLHLNGEISPGVVGLKPTQHLLIFGLIFTVDALSSR